MSPYAHHIWCIMHTSKKHTFFGVLSTLASTPFLVCSVHFRECAVNTNDSVF